MTHLFAKQRKVSQSDLVKWTYSFIAPKCCNLKLSSRLVINATPTSFIFIRFSKLKRIWGGKGVFLFHPCCNQSIKCFISVNYSKTVHSSKFVTSLGFLFSSCQEDKIQFTHCFSNLQKAWFCWYGSTI